MKFVNILDHDQPDPYLQGLDRALMAGDSVPAKAAPTRSSSRHGAFLLRRVGLVTGTSRVVWQPEQDRSDNPGAPRPAAAWFEDRFLMINDSKFKIL
jgi:hypothetical protein